MVIKNNNLKIWMMICLALTTLVVFPAQLSYAATTQTNAQATETCGGGSINMASNVKDSFILSVVTLCLPGIVEKAQTWKAIECQQAKCMYDAVVQGIDPSFCEERRNYAVCSEIMGEIFAFTPLGMIEYFKQKIAEFLANPQAILFGIGMKSLRTTITTACINDPSGSTCTSSWVGPTAVGLALMDLAALESKYEAMKENAPWDEDAVDTAACDSMDEIREELEGIVDYYNEVSQNAANSASSN